PIEYIGFYRVLRDGKPVAETRSTSFKAVVPGEYQVIGVSTDSVESFASEPLANFDTYVYEMPGETTFLNSPEISYKPAVPLRGYHGEGFVETDHAAGIIDMDITVADEGDYAITLVYANGNGPVNTENKCAIRTIEIDGIPAGTVVMPQRGTGNWNDWGRSNSVTTALKSGTHRLSINFRAENENMNLGTNHALIDRVILQKIK
ncbi:MAG: hypothetical protein K2L77_00010, partial [Muribaculaceae bacterium]|nr:hypothetical protein [Muribaculaceae bacterium]